MSPRTNPWTVPLVVATRTLSGVEPKANLISGGRYEPACYCNSYSSRSLPWRARTCWSRPTHFAHQRQRLVKPDLAELVAPAHTAVVTQEVQGAVMGPNAGLAVLAAEALPNIARLFAGAAKGVDVTPGSEGATLLPEAGPEPSDVVLTRWHGIGPMGGTDLDAILRNLGVSTIVAVGRLVEHRDSQPRHGCGQRRVPRGRCRATPSPACPAEYGAAVIDNSLSLLGHA